MSNKRLLSRRDVLKYAGLGSMILGAGALTACAKEPQVTEEATAEEQTPEPEPVAGDVLNRILQEKKMTVAVVIYPPDTYKEDGELKGIFVEAAKWLAEQMEVEVNFLEAEFGTFVAAIQAGRADIALAPTFATVARATAVDFTKGVYYMGYGALVRKEDVDKWASIEDADQPGVTFVEREGSPTDKWCTQNLQNADYMPLEATADPSHAALEVMAGRADINIQDQWLVKKLAAEHSDQLAELPAYAEKPWRLNRVGWAVAKGQAGLLSVLNVAIDYLLQNDMLQGWQTEFDGHGLYEQTSYYLP